MFLCQRPQRVVQYLYFPSAICQPGIVRPNAAATFTVDRAHGRLPRQELGEGGVLDQHARSVLGAVGACASTRAPADCVLSASTGVHSHRAPRARRLDCRLARPRRRLRLRPLRLGAALFSFPVAFSRRQLCARAASGRRRGQWRCRWARRSVAVGAAGGGHGGGDCCPPGGGVPLAGCRRARCSSRVDVLVGTAQHVAAAPVDALR